MIQKLKYLLVFLTVGMVASCAEEAGIPTPDHLIPKTEMVEILTDVCKVEARFQRRLSIRGKNNSELVLHNYKVIFTEHGVDLTQFKTSYEYYEESPEVMQDLYDSVIVKLNKEQTLLQESLATPKSEN